MRNVPTASVSDTRLIIVSGLSGSGKSIALQMLEDLDYYCIDNIPAGLLQSFVSETVQTQDPAYALTAVGLDARNRPAEITLIPAAIERLRASGVRCELVFLDSDDDVLLKRFSETRRKHPLTRTDQSLPEAIALERRLLAPIIDAADLVLDTTRTSVHELRDIIRKRVHRRDTQRMSLMFESFGFKLGVPSDADFVFDSRCLPNPYWEPALRPLTGKDRPVIEFLESQAVVEEMLSDLTSFLQRWVGEFQRTNRAYMTIAVGCTGGQHRSVYLVEALARRFSESDPHIEVLKRHIGLPPLSGEIFES